METKLFLNGNVYTGDGFVQGFAVVDGCFTAAGTDEELCNAFPDAEKYDLFIGMDVANLRNMRRILGDAAKGRIFNLLDFSSTPRDISDPWYTGDFETTYADIQEGCQALLKVIGIQG